MKYLPLLMLTVLFGCGRAEEPKPSPDLKVGDPAPEIKSENWLNATASPKAKVLIVEFFNPQKYDEHKDLRMRLDGIRKNPIYKQSAIGYMAVTSASLHDIIERSSKTNFPNYPVAFNKKLYDAFAAKDGGAVIIIEGKIAWAGDGKDIEAALAKLANVHTGILQLKAAVDPLPEKK